MKIDSPYYPKGGWLRIGSDDFTIQEMWLNVEKLEKPKKRHEAKGRMTKPEKGSDPRGKRAQRRDR